MNRLLLGFLVTLIACGQKSYSQEQSKIEINLDKYVGVYEFVYPDNTPDLIENHYIVLRTSKNKITGLYYGTSDEFDDAREGYLPGFFVSPMEKLDIIGDTLHFTLNTKNEDLLTQPIDLKYKSTQDAINAGNEKWGHKMTLTAKTYIGLMKDSETIFIKGEQEFQNKTFKKKK